MSTVRVGPVGHLLSRTSPAQASSTHELDVLLRLLFFQVTLVPFVI